MENDLFLELYFMRGVVTISFFDRLSARMRENLPLVYLIVAIPFGLVALYYGKMLELYVLNPPIGGTYIPPRSVLYMNSPYLMPYLLHLLITFGLLAMMLIEAKRQYDARESVSA